MEGANLFLAVLLAMVGATLFFARRLEMARHEATRRELDDVRGKLRAMRAEVKSLSGLLPMCAWCKKIRDDAGYWQQLEGYIQTHTEAEFSHSMCPDCFDKMQADMPDARWRI